MTLKILFPSYRLCDLRRSPELPELEVPGVLGNGLSQHLRRLGLSFRLDNLLLLLLLGAVHHEGRPLGLLLGYLHDGKNETTSGQGCATPQLGRVCMQFCMYVHSIIVWTKGCGF